MPLRRARRRNATSRALREIQDILYEILVVFVLHILNCRKTYCCPAPVPKDIMLFREKFPALVVPISCLSIFPGIDNIIRNTKYIAHTILLPIKINFRVRMSDVSVQTCRSTAKVLNACFDSTSESYVCENTVEFNTL